MSKWQGEINWNQVASDGVKYVFIKATEGTSLE
ncbi:GH25 family lysozyme [Brevibacillus laterosporus]|nr:GH25 family lysozyme [Brevibacillus laterosporus]MED1666924.1 GH25 family lysozyme [Brevibacillus laterosporus]MED1717267.1 GH25 family lysozyme [Brevibacillus laterosporus]